MAGDRFSGFTATFVHAGGTLAINQLGNATVNTNRNITTVKASGSVDPLAQVIASGAPMATIGTRDIATVFGVVSPTAGLACSGASTFNYQKRANAGVFSGSTTNTKLTAQTGFLCPDTLSAQGDSPAELTLKLYPFYDGTNEPFLPANSVDLSGVTAPAYNSVFYLGPLYLGATQIEGLTQTRVDFGINFSQIPMDGNVYPKEGMITVRQPSITLTVLKMSSIVANFTNFFHYAVASDAIKVYFAKGVHGTSAARVAALTTSHCKVTVATGALGAEDVTVADENDATITYRVNVTSTIALSVASAIP